MKDIVKRLKGINEESLIMAIVRDCMDAAEEIERLRTENEAMVEALKKIKKKVHAKK